MYSSSERVERKEVVRTAERRSRKDAVAPMVTKHSRRGFGADMLVVFPRFGSKL